MPHDIIRDAEKDVAALIDPVAGKALGPLLAGGERAVQLLETFAGAYDRDIAEIEHSKLLEDFRGFVAALTEPDQPAAGEPGAAAPAEAAAPAGAEAAPATAPAEAAGPGETGGLAGSPQPTEKAAPGDQPGGSAPPAEGPGTGVVADGGLPTGIEPAPPAGDEPGTAAATPAEIAQAEGHPAVQEPGAGIPLAPPAS